MEAPSVPADLVPAGGLPPLPSLPCDLTPPVRASAAQQRQYEELGYTLLPGLIDQHTIAELRHAVDAMVEHAIGTFSFEPSAPSLIQRISHPDQHSHAFRRLMRCVHYIGRVAAVAVRRAPAQWLSEAVCLFGMQEPCTVWCYRPVHWAVVSTQPRQVEL
jgi:hypothetical protein